MAERLGSGIAEPKTEGVAEEEAHGEAEVCPVCQEPLEQELAMLPCGHQLCVRCHMALVDHAPPGPKVSGTVAQALPCQRRRRFPWEQYYFLL